MSDALYRISASVWGVFRFRKKMSKEIKEIKPYVRSLEDELDWKLLDQLFGIVSQISNFCFEIKKFCVTTEFVVLAFFAKFTADRLDTSFFIIGAIVPVCFWLIDAVAYYYQVKLRGTMEAIRSRIVDRHKEELVISVSDDSKMAVISEKRIKKKVFFRIIDAAINHSMWIYAFLIAGDLMAWWLFKCKIII